MSESFLPQPNGVRHTHRSPNSELAALLSQTYAELEAVKADLAATIQRAEKAERFADQLVAANDNDGAARAVVDAEARVLAAERARDEADVRRRIVTEAWGELERYLQVVDIRSADARAGFARIVQDGGGHLVLSPIPLPGAQPTSSHRSHRMPPMHALPLPPPPNANPRHDDMQPPAKKSRHDSSSYHAPRPPRPSASAASLLPHHPLRHPQSSLQNAAAPPYARGAKRSRSRSASSSHSRATTDDLEDLILEAATDRRGDAVRNNDSHPPPVFTPPVTSAPSKKPRYNSIITPAASSVNVAHGSTSAPHGSVNHALAVPVDTSPPPPAVVYPQKNEAGQRICRQCGVPGRYKEGKCVEKWGPGPLGPGTVCDRCRKKFKRVERRGTIDGLEGHPTSLSLSTSTRVSPSANLQRTDTLPVYSNTQRHSPPPAIATLPDTSDVDMDIVAAARPAPAPTPQQAARSSPSRSPRRDVDSVLNMLVDSEADAEADGDADADAEAEPDTQDAEGGAAHDHDHEHDHDAEAEAELLEAVDAAEAMKNEDA
ncbi:hypothetical protein PLICRDRAFT_180581 [Plicaturopsis crispa FD-325 SS-3]|uniref:Uncharacterized protein n=1 Tax=Plicaturopsis crispa FD-325 SS-3 TaxID=944288 RepID=A0A0C9T267_PLICR|nr:hypothetical protein PLICRDRAFT_180581 [Plicaturopsis crispa FD-325 SS-3]